VSQARLSQHGGYERAAGPERRTVRAGKIRQSLQPVAAADLEGSLRFVWFGGTLAALGQACFTCCRLCAWFAPGRVMERDLRSGPRPVNGMPPLPGEKNGHLARVHHFTCLIPTAR
jgi:hypothetical protein